MYRLDNIEAGHQFMAKAVLAASEAARSAPQPKEEVMKKIEQEINCALAHYGAAFTVVE